MRNAGHKNKILGNMKGLSRIAFVLPLVVLGFTGCREAGNAPSGFASMVSVSPSSMTVAAGSTSRFTASFTPSLAEGGTVTWSVNPANGGTITNAGVYTASATAGKYTVVATWTNPFVGTTMSSSATVEVLPVPQTEAVLNTDFVGASGTAQAYGSIQNTAIAGQLVPSMTSTDASGNVQTRSGFTIPDVCAGSDTSCP
jgi:hypothetical protein